MMHHFFVQSHCRQSLEDLLLDYMSAEDLNRACRSGGIWLQNKDRLFEPDHLILPGQTLTVYQSDRQGMEYQLPESHLLYEGQDFLVVYKPPLMPSTPDQACLQWNLTWAVRHYLKQSGQAYDCTAMTRLDYHTRGLVLLAKNKPTERALFAALKHRTMGKLYWAATQAPHQLATRTTLTDGVLFQKKAVISREGKSSTGLFIPDQNNPCLLGVVLKTGRRHQIRVQCAHHFAPLLGDTLYDAAPLPAEKGIGLMAIKLHIPHNHRKIKVRVPDRLLDQFISDFQV